MLNGIKVVFLSACVHYIGDLDDTKTVSWYATRVYTHELNCKFTKRGITRVLCMRCATCDYSTITHLAHSALSRITYTINMADTHAVGLKLPVFWTDHPRVYLQQAEAQFAFRNITADDTKYHYLVAALDQTTALRVIDILEDPPQHNRCGNMKRRLTDIFGLSRRQRADRLLDIGLQSLGHRRPSQLMDEMLALLGSHKPCMLFESIFLKCLPEDIRLQLATTSFDD